MIPKNVDSLRALLEIHIPEAQKQEFKNKINRINVFRGKLTAITFLCLDSALFILSLFLYRQIFEPPRLCYEIMYLLMIAVMAVFIFLFIRIEKNVPGNSRKIVFGGWVFIFFILLWCGGISALDYRNSDQTMVYMFAMIAVAAFPILEPAVSLMIYAMTQTAFLAMVWFISYRMPFSILINSIGFAIISWMISATRYKRYELDFHRGKIIEQKNEELNRMNRELQAANQKLEKLSRLDSMTGIPNRMVFDETLAAVWNDCSRRPGTISLMMIDIDFFKAFNDFYGHQAGDTCIRKIACTMSACAARLGPETVTRYGGEEFAVVLPLVSNAEACRLAEDMRQKVEGLKIPHPSSPISEFVTISVGVCSMTPSQAVSKEKLIFNADMALYEAKKTRNRIVGDFSQAVAF